jgi:hypothetical protein
LRYTLLLYFGLSGAVGARLLILLLLSSQTKNRNQAGVVGQLQKEGAGLREKMLQEQKNTYE